MSIDIKKISIKDFVKVCRTCLSEKELLPLYGTCSNSVCLVEMLMSCTFVQFSKDEGLPQQICRSCVEQIKQTYKFAKNCEEIDEVLRRSMKKKSNRKYNKKHFKAKEIKEEIANDVEIIEPVGKLIIDEKIPEEVDETKEGIIKLEDNYCNIYKDDEFSDDDDSEGEEDSCWDYEPISNDKKSTENRVRVKKKRNAIRGPPFPCQQCDITFQTYSEYQTHRKEVKHPYVRPRVSCTVCQKLCAAYSLKQHMRTHTKERPYICTHCGRAFTLNRNLNRHMMIHTGERPYKCNMCDKAFIQMISLKEHMNKHSGQTTFVCSICGITFKYNSLLWKHMRNKHKEEADEQDNLFEHECPTCNRRYHTKQILKQHMLMHGEKTYLCSVCGKGFYNNAGLQTHIKVHTGHRPHACHVCGKAFRQTSGLKTHILIHTGEKPYICTICNKAFTQRNHLRYHMRTHTGEKPYTCSVCGKSFSTNGTLTVHKRTHTGETPYVCPICRKGFYDSSSMKKHLRGHGEQNVNN